MPKKNRIESAERLLIVTRISNLIEIVESAKFKDGKRDAIPKKELIEESIEGHKKISQQQIDDQFEDDLYELWEDILPRVFADEVQDVINECKIRLGRDDPLCDRELLYKIIRDAYNKGFRSVKTNLIANLKRRGKI